LPIIDIAAGVDPSNCDIGAYLDPTKSVDVAVIFYCTFCEEAVIL